MKSLKIPQCSVEIESAKTKKNYWRGGPPPAYLGLTKYLIKLLKFLIFTKFKIFNEKYSS